MLQIRLKQYERIVKVLGYLRKVYWPFAYITLCTFMYRIAFKIGTDFNQSSLTLTIDAAYINWDVPFPAISICEIYNGEKNWELNEKYYGAERNKEMDNFMADISFFSGTCYNCHICKDNTTANCPTNLTETAEKFRADCKDILHICKWNNKEFDCCTYFRPIATEFGTCYAINSMHTLPPFAKKLTSNRIDGPGSITVIAHEDIQIFIHSPIDIPHLYIEKDLTDMIMWGTNKEILMAIIAIENDESVIDVPLKERSCLFPEETYYGDKEAYQIYSMSTCVQKCYKDIQMQTCKCIHHLMPTISTSNNSFCDIKGLECLTEKKATISDERRKCNCPANCEDPEYNIVYSSQEMAREEPGSQITISLVHLPYQRYYRKTMKSQLDLIISIGGIVGLFFGASILTSIEWLDSIYRFFKKHIQRCIKSTIQVNTK